MNLLNDLRAIFDKSGIKRGAQATLDMDIQKDLNIDSVDIVGIVMEMEKHFDIHIEDDEIEPVKTVAELIAIIDSKLEKAHAV